MKKLALSSLLVLLLPLNCWAQLDLAFDSAAFRYDSSQAYVEFFYSILTSSLNFVATGSGTPEAQVMVQLSILKDDSVLVDNAWRMQKSLPDSSQLQQGQRMVDVLHYLARPGHYSVSIYVEDLNDPESSNRVTRDFTIEVFPQNDLRLSDIQFANSIKRVPKDTSNVFYKNGLEVIPEPTETYSQNNPVLYYYLEAYNVRAAVKHDRYITRMQVTDANGQLLQATKPRQQIKRTVDSSVEIGSVDISSVPTGTYYLDLAILNTEGKPLQSMSKRFYVYNPDIESKEIAIEGVESAISESKFASMNEKELNSEFQMTQYIATNQEKTLFKKLKDIKAKRIYLYQFWQHRDPTPGTIWNEYREEYMSRINYANEHFSSYTRKGWKTDRGRVYTLYGHPDEIERFPNNPLSYSYQIWHYDHIEGGVIFVFADLQEFGEYTQLHSTKRGEPMNQDWERQIRK